MPKGTPRAGFRRTKKRKRLTKQEIEEELLYRTPEVLTELDKLVRPFSCPHCDKEIKIIDKDIGMWLVDHGIGRSTQKHEVDVTEHIQLSADQIDAILFKNLPQIVEMYHTEIIRLLVESHRAEIAGLLTEGKCDIIEGEFKEV